MILNAGYRRPKSNVSEAIHTSTRRTRGTRGNRCAPAPWVRHTITLLALVWLNVAIAPCVMALTPAVGTPVNHLSGSAPDSGVPERHHCPHCPPAQVRSVTEHGEESIHPCPRSGSHQAHASGASSTSTAADTGAEDAHRLTPVTCVDSGSDCDAFDATPPEGRGADLKVKPGAELVYLAPAWPVVPVRRSSELPPRWRTLSYLPGPPPALNCLHCVYLK